MKTKSKKVVIEKMSVQEMKNLKGGQSVQLKTVTVTAKSKQ